MVAFRMCLLYLNCFRGFKSAQRLLRQLRQMKRQGKKKEQNGSANGDSLQVPENQTVDNEDIPLVLVNNGTESAGTRKRSRAISRVSMSSDDGATKEKQEVGF